MKKILNIALLFVLFFSTMTTAFVQSANGMVIENTSNENTKMVNYTKDAILTLEPYVSVEDGFFKLNAEEATKNGIDFALIQGQQGYFDLLNEQANNGELMISQDLTIEDLTQSKQPVIQEDSLITTLAACKGISRGPEPFWWGHRTYADSCDTKKLISDANTAAAAGGLTGSGVGIIGLFFPIMLAPAGVAGLTGAYFWLFSVRLDANNNGKGVIVDLTWAAVFDITPQ